jgi:D-lactate dehydrogenase
MVDLDCAHRLGFKLVRVPAYSPYAVAELAVGLILNLNRKLHKAYNRVRDDNFSLEGLIGFDLHGCQVGVVGNCHHHLGEYYGLFPGAAPAPSSAL